MNVDNLENKMIVKNYRVMCEILETDERTGKSKQLQLKDWERYFTYSKQGQKFIIDNIYEQPMLKEENMRNTAPYIQYAEILLMQLLLTNEKKALVISNTELATRLNMVHRDFKKYYGSRGKLSAMLEIDYATINEFMNATNDAFKNAINTIINRLKNKMAIIYELRWRVMVNEYDEDTESFEAVYRFANSYEKQYIANIRAEVLAEFFDNNMPKVRAMNKLDDYYDRVNERLKNEVGLLRAYDVHEITFNHRAIEDAYLNKIKMLDILNAEEIVELKKNINSLFAKRTIENAESRMNRAFEKKELYGYGGLSPVNSTRVDMQFINKNKRLTKALIEEGVFTTYQKS